MHSRLYYRRSIGAECQEYSTVLVIDLDKFFCVKGLFEFFIQLAYLKLAKHCSAMLVM